MRQSLLNTEASAIPRLDPFIPTMRLTTTATPTKVARSADREERRWLARRASPQACPFRARRATLPRTRPTDRGAIADVRTQGLNAAARAQFESAACTKPGKSRRSLSANLTLPLRAGSSADAGTPRVGLRSVAHRQRGAGFVRWARSTTQDRGPNFLSEVLSAPKTIQGDSETRRIAAPWPPAPSVTFKPRRQSSAPSLRSVAPRLHGLRPGGRPRRAPHSVP